MKERSIYKYWVIPARCASFREEACKAVEMYEAGAAEGGYERPEGDEVIIDMDADNGSIVFRAVDPVNFRTLTKGRVKIE